MKIFLNIWSIWRKEMGVAGWSEGQVKAGEAMQG